MPANTTDNVTSWTILAPTGERIVASSVLELINGHRHLFTEKQLKGKSISFSQAYLGLSYILHIAKKNKQLASWRGWYLLKYGNICEQDPARIAVTAIIQARTAKMSPEQREEYLQNTSGQKRVPKRKGTLNAADEHNCKAKFWVIKSPKGVVLQGNNLNKLIKDNAHLFDAKDLVIHEKNQGSRARNGINAAFQKGHGWKGWTVIQATERQPTTPQKQDEQTNILSHSDNLLHQE